MEKWAAFFCPLFHNLPERKEKKYFANTQHFYTKFQNKLSQIIDTFRCLPIRWPTCAGCMRRIKR